MAVSGRPSSRFARRCRRRSETPRIDPAGTRSDARSRRGPARSGACARSLDRRRRHLRAAGEPLVDRLRLPSDPGDSRDRALGSWVVLWILARPQTGSIELPILGPVPSPFAALVASLLVGYVIARLLGAHAGWLGSRWSSRVRDHGSPRPWSARFGRAPSRARSARRGSATAGDDGLGHRARLRRSRRDGPWRDYQRPVAPQEDESCLVWPA